MRRRERSPLAALVDRLRPGRPTPKSVYALAASGQPATAIARKTGLPVDAVAMLIQLGAASAAAPLAMR
jgi:hypothetical protein